MTQKKIAKMIILISFPIVLQIFLRTSLGFVDRIMVGQLGETAIASVGASDQIISFMIIIFSVVGTGVSILGAQYIGRQNIEKLKKLFGTSVMTGIVFSLLLTLFFSYEASNILRFVHAPESVIKQGRIFLMVSAFSITAMILTAIISSIFRAGTQNVPPLISAFVSLFVNVLLDYIFIFICHFGVFGAALATLISRYVELMFLMIYLERSQHTLFLTLKDSVAFSLAELKKIIRLGWPISVDMLLWQLSLMINMSIILSLGTEIASANEILKLITSLIFTPAVGIGMGISALVGQELGKNAYESGLLISKVGLKLSALFIAISTAIVLLLARDVPQLFHFSIATKHIATQGIEFTSLFLMFQLGNLIFPNILRAGGDTKIIIMISSIGIWGVGIPMTLFFVYGLKWGFLGAILGYNSGEIVKSALFFRRYIQKKWLKTLIA